MTWRDGDALFKGAARSLAEGLALIDVDGRLVYLNPRAAEFFGMKTEDWLSRPAIELYQMIATQTRRSPALSAELTAAASNPLSLPTVEFTVNQPRERAIEAQWFDLKGEGDRSIGYGVLFRDVSREKELDQMKTQLLSTVSHELRTPLASIKGFATTLLRDDVQWDEATQRDFLKIIEEESDRLGELIDNLLDMSQIEEGALRIEKEPVQLRQIVREAVDRIQKRGGSHWFLVDLPSELPRVWADPRRILQVLRNLLENAIKYSPGGGQVTISCEVEPDHVVVSVSDSGQGIPAEFLERVFERFFQVDGANTRKTGGSGLGLAISKGIVQAHGGTIWAESKPSHGSSFRFTLPIVAEPDIETNEG